LTFLSVPLVALERSNTSGQEASSAEQVPVPGPVQQAFGSPDCVQAAFGKTASVRTFMVNPVTPEDSWKTRSMAPLLLPAGTPPVLTAVSVPPVTVPTVSVMPVVMALFVLVGRVVWRVEVPEYEMEPLPTVHWSVPATGPPVPTILSPLTAVLFFTP
jgi:hypothetical protein